jgi:hypothetical protein
MRTLEGTRDTKQDIMKLTSLLLATGASVVCENLVATAFVVQRGGRTSEPSHFLLAAARTPPVDQETYKPQKIKGDEEFDTIIIGSGIGGLCTASLLAQQGQKVLVLEQHYVAGGACHCFTTKGYRFATGIHYVGDMGPATKTSAHFVSLKRLMDTLAPANDPVLWDRIDGEVL